MLAFFIQRLPILSHLAILWIVLAGPKTCPTLFTWLFCLVHLLLLVTNLQSLWGTFCAWRGVQKCAQTDWYSYWKTKSSEDERSLDRSEIKGKTLHFHEIQHIVIIPAYKEEKEILEETLDILASHARAKTNYRICLGMEERDAGSQNMAKIMLDCYRDRFLSLTSSVHPTGIHGEVAGKSSNVNWAARQMASRGTAFLHERQIITVMDSDTALAQDYFDCVTAKYCLANSRTRERMMFAVPIIFDRNADRVPIFVKFVDACWSIAGLCSIYPTSACKIPTSSYGLSMQLAMAVDYWDSGPEAIGEDMHMAIKCFLCTGGTVHVETVYSPASQLNVVGDHHGGFKGYYSALQARYQQAVRHMWGSLDFGYATRRILVGDVGKMYALETAAKEESSTVSSRTPILATRSFKQVLLYLMRLTYMVCCIRPRSILKIPALISARRTFRNMNLMLRLFQAHLLIAWGFIILSFIQIVPLTLLLTTQILARCDESRSPNMLSFCTPSMVASTTALHFALETSMVRFSGPKHTVWTPLAISLFICQLIRQLSFPLSLITYFFHIKYHQVGAVDRWNSPTSSSRLGLRPRSKAARPLPWAMLELAAFPASFLYGLVPTLHAQVLHLFTNQMNVTSSTKSIKLGTGRDPLLVSEKQ